MGKIYNSELSVIVMPMEGSSYISKKLASIIGSDKLPVPTLQTNFVFV
jgi:hypothetical protein